LGVHTPDSDESVPSSLVVVQAVLATTHVSKNENADSRTPHQVLVLKRSSIRKEDEAR
jgi:hypothetical protein